MTSKDRFKHLPKGDAIINPKKSKINHSKRNQHENFIASNENEQERARKRNRSKDRFDQYYTKKSRTISPIRYIPRFNKKEDRFKGNHHYHYNNHRNRPKTTTHVNRERITNCIKQSTSTNSSNVKHNSMMQTHSGLKNQKKNESPTREKTSPAKSASSSSLPSCQCSCNCSLNLDEGELEEGEIYCKQNDHTNKSYTSDSNCNNEKSQTYKRNISIRHEEVSSTSKVPSTKTASERNNRTNSDDNRRESFRKKYSESLSNQNIYLKFERNKTSSHKGYGDEDNKYKNGTKSSTKRQIGRASQRSSSQCMHFSASKNTTPFQVRRDRHSSSSHSVHDEIRKSTFCKRSPNKSNKDEKFRKRSSESEKRPKVIPLRSRNICSTPSKSDGCKKSKLRERSRAMNNNNTNKDRPQQQRQSQQKRQWKSEQLNKTDKKVRRNSFSKLEAVLSRPRTSHANKYNDSLSVKKPNSKITNRFELSRTKESKSDSRLLPEKKNKDQISGSKIKRETSSSSPSTTRLDKINHDSNHVHQKNKISEKNEIELHGIHQNDYSKGVEDSKPENITPTITTTTTNFENLNIAEALKNLNIMEKRPKLHFVSKSIQFQMLKEAKSCRKFCGESLYQQLQEILQTDSEQPTPTILPFYHRDRISRPKYMKLPTSTNLDLQTFVPLQISTKLAVPMHKLRVLSQSLFYS